MTAARSKADELIGRRGVARRRSELEEGNPEALVAVAEVMEAASLIVDPIPHPTAPKVRWFSSTGAVMVRGAVHSVLVGGLLRRVTLRS